MKVIFFDGVCGLCNSFIDFILRIDVMKKFQFSPLQSEYAKKHVPEEFTVDLKSIVYQCDEKVYIKSDAVIRILNEIGGLWKLVSIIGRCLPLSFRNQLYDLVASNRYRIFGKNDSCRIPSPEERSRFVS